MALCSFSFVACSDDDYTPGKSDLDADRELMTMFRVDDNTNKGSTAVHTIPTKLYIVDINHLTTIRVCATLSECGYSTFCRCL